MRRRAARELEWLWTENPNDGGNKYLRVAADYVGMSNQVNVNLAQGTELIVTRNRNRPGYSAILVFKPGGIYPDHMEPPPHGVISALNETDIQRVIEEVEDLLGGEGHNARGYVAYNFGLSYSLSEDPSNPERRFVIFDFIMNTPDDYTPTIQTQTNE